MAGSEQDCEACQVENWKPENEEETDMDILQQFQKWHEEDKFVPGDTPFEGFDLTSFWDDSMYALKEYVSEPPSDELITSVENELGYKLPASYIWLMKQHNGGIPRNTCYPCDEPTCWAEDHVAITGIFGIGREKSCSLCGELGIGCDIIPKVVQDHITISSTYIRTLVAQGEMERANQFLGHPHTLTDTVAHGKKLGGTLGFPTVNLRFQPGVLVPAHGVYATRVTFENGESRPAVTNIGVRPTVDDGDRVTVEGFILDFQGDLYGQTVRMEFYKRLRGERKFPSLEALKDEVMRNAEQTRTYFSTQP